MSDDVRCMPNDMREFADRHKLGTFMEEVYRQAKRDAEAELDATIRELEAELAASREQCQELLDATGQHCGCGYDKPSDICLMHGGRLMAGVRAGTHVIVPFEPTDAMVQAAASKNIFGEVKFADHAREIYRAMIKAAQE